MINYHPIPVLFSVGPIEVYSGGLSFFLAFLIGFLLGVKEIRRKGLDIDDFKKMFFLIMLGAIIGARLFFVLENVKYFSIYPIDILKIWRGGTSSYGGFIGGFIIPFVYFKKFKLDFWSYADALVPSVCIGIFIKRIGCFLNWCCYGMASNLPWAVNVGDFPRHPTQIYLAMNGLILFFIFLWLRKMVRPSSTLFLLFVISYAGVRFLIEFLRDSERYILNLTMAQITSLVILFVALLYFNKRKSLLN
ncbi:MAG: prolipoprotein diacylglyceryl transferase [Candidatus Aminicenantia bacterium]